jgi:hypothetical protein
LPQGLQVGLAEGCQRLVLRLERLSQPQDFAMPVGLLFQTTTRPQTRERAVQGQRQPISRVRGQPAWGSGSGALKAKPREVEVIDTGIKATDGLCCGKVVIKPLWTQDGCVAVRAVEKTHESPHLQKSKKVSRDRAPCESLSNHGVFTQSGAWFGGSWPPKHCGAP